MSTLRETKRRIKTAKNIGQVTRALEMVSAVKMKKAQAAALLGRDYTTEMERVLRILNDKVNDQQSDFFTARPINKMTLVIVGPQKGLVGPLLTNLFRQVSRLVNNMSKEKLEAVMTDTYSVILANEVRPGSPSTLRDSGQARMTVPELGESTEISFVTIERKGKDVARLLKKPIIADFGHLGRTPQLVKVRPIADYLVNLYRNGETDLILIAYAHFINTVTHKIALRQYLPILRSKESQEEQGLAPEILFEPSTGEVLDALIVSYSEAILYQIILESLASEHSSRMIAMKNAHDNASEIVEDLTLDYNRGRQDAVTSEILDIVSGSLVTSN